MTSIARYERTRLADLAEELGPDAPTLCDGWTVRDLVVHLLVRERSPAAAGILVRPLSGVLDTVSARHARRDFATLVEELRKGPPVWSPFAIPKVGDALNTIEYFVHHEDVRRAQPQWEPRELPAKVEDALWRGVRALGRAPVVRTKLGLVAVREDTGERTRLKKGDRDVVLRGRPAELVMYLYGRKEEADVTLDGDAADVAAVAGSRMGI